MAAMDVWQVDHRSDRPVYRQIADILRAQIDAGVYQPGDTLPSATQLMARTGVARETVRQAIEVLRLEGRVRTQQGKGVFVQAEIRPVITRNSDRLRRKHREGAGRGPLRVDEANSEVDLDYDVWELAEVRAPASVAADLRVPPGETVFVRRRIVSYKDGPPVKLADSYLPLDIAIGRIRDRNSGSGGIYQRIEDNGHRLTSFNERLTFRMPTPDEKRSLRLDDGIPVIDLVRIASTTERPVECFVAVMAGDTNRFEYDIEVDDEH